MLVEAVGYVFSIFTVPANGKFFYTAYYICSAICMAGANGALINLVYDYVDVEKRADAIAVTQTVAGVVGFLTTLAVSPLVSFIQQSGNKIFGISVYAQQVVSLLAFVMTIITVVYLKLTFGREKRVKR